MTTRRDFLKGMAALAVVPVVPAIAEALRPRSVLVESSVHMWNVSKEDDFELFVSEGVMADIREQMRREAQRMTNL